jgi:ABC-type nitrate/sulfonate/bicarbonate transport system permease component
MTQARTPTIGKDGTPTERRLRKDAFSLRLSVTRRLIASTDGIGYQIFNAQQYFQSARIVVGMLAIGIVWLLLDRVVLRPIEQRTTVRWGLMREGIENT